MEFLFRLWVLPIMAIPFVGWYMVMTHAFGEEYPKWLQKIFKIKYFGKIVEHSVIIFSVFVVLYMILFFKLPD